MKSSIRNLYVSAGTREAHSAMLSRRCKLVFGVLILAAVGLCTRLVLLVHQRDAESARRAIIQQRMVIPLPGRCGSIFARSYRRYVPLAVSKQVPSCYADPSMLADNELFEVSVRLAEALDLDPTEVHDKILQRRRRRFAYVKRDISAAEAKAVRKLRIPAVSVTQEWRRIYPNRELAATVVGFRRIDGVPGGGLELTLQRYLGARDGTRVVLTDAQRRPIWSVPSQTNPPIDGAQVYLTLDAVIQGYLQEALSASVEKFSAQWGTGMVVNPSTGEVLAMCSVPTFDPNRYNRANAASQTNRSVSVPFEPGSAFKPIIAAAAVDSGLLSYSSEIFCEHGTYRAHRGGRIRDHGEAYGYLSLADGVILSSNICLAKVGEKLGNDALYKIVKRFGFGERTGIGLPAESPGIIRPLRQWNGYSLRRVPFGQEISVTPLQLAMAFSALANGGTLLKPRIIEKVTDVEGKVIYRGRREVVRRVLAPPVAAQTLAVMQGVVERGTGRSCRLTNWTSFGKTGPAQIPGPGGYLEGEYTGTFIGGAPASNPRLICLISIYSPERAKGYYGSVVAAPYVKDVLTRSLTYLKVPPDKHLGKGLAAASVGVSPQY